MTAGEDPRLLLLQWDGADLNILLEMSALGRLPNVTALMERGGMSHVRGTRLPVAAAVSVATGLNPCDHGFLTDIMPDSQAPEGLRSILGSDWTHQALWSRLSETGFRTHAINWPASHPAVPLTGVSLSNHFYEDVPPRVADPWRLGDGAVVPADCREVFDTCRLHPSEIDGDSLVSFLPLASDIDQDADVRLAHCAALIAETSSVHAAALWTIEHRPWDFAALYYPGFDHFSESFMTYRPPQLASTSDRDLALYGQVIDAAYAFHDLMLGAILSAVDDDVTVVLASGFGFQTGPARPIKPPSSLQGMVSLRRPNGFVLAAGPHADAFSSPAMQSFTGVAPAIGSVFGLNGTSKTVPQTGTSTGSAQKEKPRDCHEALQRYGYLAAPSDDASAARTCFIRDHRLLQAQMLMDAKRFNDAELLLDELAAAFPDDVSIGTTRAFCQFNLERFAACRTSIEDLMERGVKTALSYLGLAAVALSERDMDTARAFLGKAKDVQNDNPAWLCMEGQLHIRLRDWDAARHTFDRALVLERDNADALTGLAAVSLGLQNAEEAMEFALQAITLNQLNAISHYRLGLALSQMGRAEEAIVPFENALVIDPVLRVAHRRLQHIYQHKLNDPVKALEHQLAAEGAGRITMSLAPAGSG